MTDLAAAKDAERISELEYQVAALSQENSQLRDQAARADRAESERAKHTRRLNQERSLESVRQLLRQPYSEQSLPTVHKIMWRLNNGNAPTDVGGWLDLKMATNELAAVKTETLATAESLRASISALVRESQRDRQAWLDSHAGAALRDLWMIEVSK